jgi:hypothetical protein
MYRVRTRRGFAAFDVTNPVTCGFTDLGVLKGVCWCASVGQTICDAVSGPGSYAAAIAAQSPATAYPNPPAPAVPAAPEGTAVPSSEAEAATLPGDMAAQGMYKTQQNNLDFFKQVAANLDQLGGGSPNSSGLSMTAIIALGLVAGVGLLFMVGSGGRRR